MAQGAVVARILSQYSDKGSKAAQKDIAKLGQKIDAFGRKATKSFAALGVASAAFAVKLGVFAFKNAAFAWTKAPFAYTSAEFAV